MKNGLWIWCDNSWRLYGMVWKEIRGERNAVITLKSQKWKKIKRVIL